MQPTHNSEWETLLSELEAEESKGQFPKDLRTNTESFAHQSLAFLFPHFRSPVEADLNALQLYGQLQATLAYILGPLALASACENLEHRFRDSLPAIRQSLLKDTEAIWKNDPAAESLDEVIAAYPGFYAIAIYRIAHRFYRCGVPFFPRLLSEHAHRLTGIDIHPGAQIGEGLSIDHGTGIVIGETAVLGDHVRLFQGVTLGALSVEKSLNGSKRHPTLEDNVVVYANATILGGQTVIGKGSTIGGNVWLTRSVDPNTTITSSKSKAAHSLWDDSIEFYI